VLKSYLYVLSHPSRIGPNTLGWNLFAVLQAGQPLPLSARQLTKAGQGGCWALMLQTHHAIYPLPRVTSLGDLSFLILSHSCARSGLPTDTVGCRVVPFFLSPHFGHPDPWLHLVKQEARKGRRPLPAQHSQRRLLWLFLATSLGGILSGCHSLDSLGSLATDWQSQKLPPLLSAASVFAT